MAEFDHLSESEIVDVINQAKKALEEKQLSKRREVVKQIQELASSINCRAQLIDLDRDTPTGARKRGKVAIKYRDPANPEHTWTGRGQRPRWLREKINQGQSIEAFEV